MKKGNIVFLFTWEDLKTLYPECSCGCKGLIKPSGAILQIDNYCKLANTFPYFEITAVVGGFFQLKGFGEEWFHSEFFVSDSLFSENLQLIQDPPKWDDTPLPPKSKKACKGFAQKEEEYYINNTPGMYKTYNGPKFGWSRNKKEETEND